MEAIKIALGIKEYLVSLAVDGKLPLDMTELNEQEIADVINGFMPSEMTKAVEAASHYLCDGDLSILEQIRAIQYHEDQYDYIDMVEGVVVWERVENTFTCGEFLQLIGL